MRTIIMSIGVLVLTFVSASVSMADTHTAERAEAEARAALEAQRKLRESQQVLCNDFDALADRIDCRLSRTPEQLEREPYAPEACQWGTADWRSSCQKRFRSMRRCYALPIGDERINCIKNVLRIPRILKPVSNMCDGEHSSCPDVYRQAVHHLIIERFYDAEVRTMQWYRQDRLDAKSTQAFLMILTNAMWDFYEAESTADRKQSIQTVDRAWHALLPSLQD